MRRRARDTGQRSILVEREAELAELEQSLAAARDGSGRIVVIEAPAGTGKSRLLTAAGDMARDAGMQILGASGKELERDFPFGVAIQLFEPRWASTGVDAWAEHRAGPAGLARGLLNSEHTEAEHAPGGQEYSLIHDPARPGELLLRARAGEQLVEHLIADPPIGRHPESLPHPAAATGPLERLIDRRGRQPRGIRRGRAARGLPSASVG